MRASSVWPRVLFVLLGLGACSRDKEPLLQPAARAEIVGARTLAQKTELPTCNPSGRGAVYYLLDEDRFVFCDGRQYVELDAVGAPGAAGTSFLVDTVDAALADCADGGVTILAGADDDGDSSLDASEVTSRAHVCDGAEGAEGPAGPAGDPGMDGEDGEDGEDGAPGADGQSPLVEIEDASAADCPNGGIVLEIGTDADGDGMLDPDELAMAKPICNASDGNDGHEALIETADATAEQCPAGGLVVQTGTDVDDDGMLDSAELSAERVLCGGRDGEDGVDGIDGHNSLIATSPASQAQCAEGGIVIRVGVDDDGDAMLDDDEVDATEVVCGSASPDEPPCDEPCDPPPGESMIGDACTSTAQCGAGLSCVDGVCCTSSCTGTCVACNVAGHLGTCWNIPNGSDPAGECGTLSCSNYYSGWAGTLNDQCYRRLDASAATVQCEGDGTCQDAADVCPSQPQGSLYLNCNDTCQTEDTSTCTGTTAGTCNNSSTGSQTCGAGACARTTARCSSGTPVTCAPGTPVAETCDDVDNDCDGVTDDGLSGDVYESNNSCSQTSYLGRLNTIGGGSSVSITPTIYGLGDVDVFRVDYRENDSTCGCGTSTDEDYSLTATLTVPVGAGSYRVCTQGGEVCGAGATCTTVAAGTSGSVTLWFDGDCCPDVWPFDGCYNSGTGWFTISGVGAPALECRSYTFGVVTGIGCR